MVLSKIELSLICQKRKDMTTDLKAGTKVLFTPTGEEFELKTVTDKRVVWYLGFSVKSSWGVNIMKTAGTSRRLFEKGIASGAYIVK